MRAASGKLVLHAEAVASESSQEPLLTIQAAAKAYLCSLNRIPCRTGALTREPGLFPYLDAHCQEIYLTDTLEDAPSDSHPECLFLLPWEVEWVIHAYRLDTMPCIPSSRKCNQQHLYEDEDEAEKEDGPTFRQWQLPAREFHRQWDKLYYEDTLKRRLLRYATTALMFSERCVDPHLVSFGRLVLLHGPPGTGKTSLAKALAQKLALRLPHDKHAELLEINANSLFSQWFSESGKLVSRLFQTIRAKLQDRNATIFVLIDEVETIAAARAPMSQGRGGGSEPFDSLRAVNTLLMEIDTLRMWPNAFVFATSNLTNAIDAAFLDRADIKAYIGPPGAEARYEILRSSINELVNVGIIDTPGEPLPSFPSINKVRMGSVSPTTPQSTGTSHNHSSRAVELGSMLVEMVVRPSEGLSGRALRKLPFLAHAGSDFNGSCPDGKQFVIALRQALENERTDRERLESPDGVLQKGDGHMDA